MFHCVGKAHIMLAAKTEFCQKSRDRKELHQDDWALKDWVHSSVIGIQCAFLRAWCLRFCVLSHQFRGSSFLFASLSDLQGTCLFFSSLF